jgi:hypothetical protein
MQLVGYSDTDWDGDLDERKFTSIYAFVLGSEAITWSGKKTYMYCFIYYEGRICSLFGCYTRGCLVVIFYRELESRHIFDGDQSLSIVIVWQL